MSKIPLPIKLTIGGIGYKIFLAYMRLTKQKLTVRDEDYTVNYIVNNKPSVARFGDGEFLWIFEERQNGEFEKNSPLLAKRLKEVLQTPQNNLIICIPKIFDGLEKLKGSSKSYWEGFLIRKGVKTLRLLNTNYQYFDTQFTRPYMDYKPNTKNFKTTFDNFSRVWENRNVVIVEGEKSRFGVGSDLLISANSVKRIICPSENAFESYNEILNKVIEDCKSIDDVLVLASLGPSATVLAYDLAMHGIQTVDIGHLDVEYNWYRMKAINKVSIPGKYVNEASVKVSDELPDEVLSAYSKQIIDRVLGEKYGN